MLPPGARIGFPVWSHDGRRLAFARDLADGVELWIGDAATASAKPVPGVRLNDVLGAPFAWEGDALLARTVPPSRGAVPRAPSVPVGPLVEETAGKASQMATFQDLLCTPFDEALFEHYARAQLVRVDARTAAVTPVGRPDLYTDAEASPDGRYRLVQRIRRPFSTRVPFDYFARVAEVWDASGKAVATVADLPVSDEVPRQGVPTGPREAAWQPLAPATVVWAEALDGGDPTRKVEHHDRLMSLGAPFTGQPAELLRVKQRFTGLDWTARPGMALVGEYDRERRWRTVSLVDLAGRAPAKVVFDLSENDAYGDPGEPVPGGRSRAASASRPRTATASTSPATARRSRATGRSSTASTSRRSRRRGCSARRRRAMSASWRSRTRSGRPPSSVRSRRASRRTCSWSTSRRARGAGSRTCATRRPSSRACGRSCCATRARTACRCRARCTCRPTTSPGTRLPALVWAYPLEYSDAATAGQVRGSTNTFPRLWGPRRSPS